VGDCVQTTRVRIRIPALLRMLVWRMERYCHAYVVTMRYVFGDYCLDTQRYELSRAGVLIPLRPKVFQVLAYLIT
jgi:DNA-binding response OmpR family regulator